jgi:hypothetical protein
VPCKWYRAAVRLVATHGQPSAGYAYNGQSREPQAPAFPPVSL